MIGNYIIAFILGILTSYIFMPYVIRFAHKIGAVDLPKEKRKIHTKPTTRLGGLAIITGFLFSLIYLFISSYCEKIISISFFSMYKTNFIGIGISIVLILIMGILDDSKGLNAFVKLFIQSLAAIITVACGIRIDNVTIFGQNAVTFNVFITYLVSFAWIILVMNSINLIDGIDCLATGLVSITLISLIVIFKINASPIIATFLAITLLGAILGYIPYNKTPAKSFVGDTGTNFLGYMLAVISILGVAKTYTLAIIIAPIISLILPLFDTIFAIIRRIVKNKSLKGVFTADRGHIHHRLLDKGFTPKQVLYIFYLVTATAGLFAILVLEGNLYKILSFLVIVMLLFIIGLNDILKEIKKEKENYINEKKD